VTLLNTADKVYPGAAAAARVYAGTDLVWPPASVASGPANILLVSYAPGSDRNDFTGQVGVRLGIGAAPYTITWIGARKHTVGGVRTVKLYEWFADALVASVTIDYTSVALGDYAWTHLAAPVVLAAGGYYALLMDVVASDGNTWANPGAAVYVAGVVNVYDSYRVGTAGSLATGMVNSSFIGLDLGWGDAGPALLGGYFSAWHFAARYFLASYFP
jgi:hypothetical protein